MAAQLLIDACHLFTFWCVTGELPQSHGDGVRQIAGQSQEKGDSRTIEFDRVQPNAMPQLQLLPGAISEILATASETNVLTLSDRYGLMAASMDETLDEEERRAVNRILRAVARGRIEFAEAA